MSVHTKWCPHGRICLQKIESGKIEVVPFGGFNIIVDDSNTVHRSALCFEQCQHFRKTFSGIVRCALEPRSSLLPVIAGSIIISLALLTVKYF